MTACFSMVNKEASRMIYRVHNWLRCRNLQADLMILCLFCEITEAIRFIQAILHTIFVLMDTTTAIRAAILLKCSQYTHTRMT